MRYIAIGLLVVCGGVDRIQGAESPQTETRVVWVSVPGEAKLMRVENPPEGMVARDRRERPHRGVEAVSRAANRELRDVAQALRGLDQSYAIRGFQGCGAATAGSVFIDWRARGISRPENVIVLPPAPLILGVPKDWHRCVDCDSPSFRSADECDCEPSTGTIPPLPPIPAPARQPQN